MFVPSIYQSWYSELSFDKSTDTKRCGTVEGVNTWREIEMLIT